MRLEVVDECVRVDLKCKTSFLQGVDDLFLGARRHEDVVREVRRDKEDGAVAVSMQFQVTTENDTYIPAIASGLVNSKTR